MHVASIDYDGTFTIQTVFENTSTKVEYISTHEARSMKPASDPMNDF